jgi:hypothetical protein
MKVSQHAADHCAWRSQDGARTSPYPCFLHKLGFPRQYPTDNIMDKRIVEKNSNFRSS